MNNVARRLGSELQPQNHAAVSDGTGDHNQQVMPSPHKSGKYFGLWFVSWTRAWTHGQYLAELGNISGRGGGRAWSSLLVFQPQRSAGHATAACIRPRNHRRNHETHGCSASRQPKPSYDGRTNMRISIWYQRWYITHENLALLEYQFHF